MAQDYRKQPEPVPGPQLAELLYTELRARAAAYLGRERADHTLSPTALVHEAFVRLEEHAGKEWQGRTHYAATAAVAMRRILVDHARARNTDKRKGRAGQVLLQTSIALDPRAPAAALDVLAVDEVLIRLAALHPRQASVVEMRFFGEFTMEEIAQALGVSLATVEADWRMARTWLHRELSK